MSHQIITSNFNGCRPLSATPCNMSATCRPSNCLAAAPKFIDDPRTLPQCDPRQGPARHCCPVGCLGHLEIVNASDVLDNAVASVVPHIHAEGEVRLGFHGQVRLDSSWPAVIYTPCCCVA